MKLRMLAGLLCLALAAGCAAGEPKPAPEEEPSENTVEPAEAPEPEENPEAPAPAEDPETANVFATLPDAFLLASGAGGWSTELTVEDDGAFSGLYQDSEMGDSGERYPNGTRYYCAFNGKFTQPVKVDETTWSMKIETMELEHPADEAEEIVDGVRYVYTGPHGLENPEELLIYLPATPVEGLSEDVLWAARGPFDWQPTEDGTLGVYVLYNPVEDLGFVEYPM